MEQGNSLQEASTHHEIFSAEDDLEEVSEKTTDTPKKKRGTRSTMEGLTIVPVTQGFAGFRESSL